MTTQAIPDFATIRKAIKEHVETTSFDQPLPGTVADPDPNPAGEPAWDEGTAKEEKNTQIQL